VRKPRGSCMGRDMITDKNNSTIKCQVWDWGRSG